MSRAIVALILGEFQLSLARIVLFFTNFLRRGSLQWPGITGQDGSYLAEHLLSMGYEVHGMLRRGRTLDETGVVLERLANPLVNGKNPSE